MEIKLLREVFANNTATLEFVGLVPFTSAVWEEKVYSAGALQITFPYTPDVINQVKIGSFAYFDNTFNKCNGALYYIHSIKITDNVITAYGAEAKWIWSKVRRGLASNGVSELVTSIVQTNLSQNIAKCQGTVTMSDAGGDASIDTYAIDGETADVIYSFSQECLSRINSGLKASYNSSTKKIDLSNYAPIDRSARFYFSRGRGNMHGTSYTISDQSYYSTVFAIGETSDGTAVYKYATDMEMYQNAAEFFAKTLRCEAQQDGESTSDYNAKVQQKAQLELNKHRRSKKISVGKLDLMDFNTANGWKLGEYVCIGIDEVNARYKAQAVSAKYVCENNHTSVTVSFDIISEITA